MAQLLVFVLDNLDLCSDLLDAWEEAGVTGVTILESTGLVRVRQALRDDLPLLPSLRDLLAGRESHHRTLFSIVQDEAVLEQAIVATQRVVGDLTRPYTGVLFTLPLSRVVGLPRA
jgi:nitrogen regulatory protein P-II 1